MLELMQCPHGGGPLHLIFDLWWLFVLAVPAVARPVAWVMQKLGRSIRHRCCGHTDVLRRTSGSEHVHCHHDHDKEVT